MTETSAVQPATPVEPPRRKRGLGIASLVLALLAIIGDVIVVLIGIGSLRSFDDSVYGGLGLLAAFVGFGAIALVVGLILAGLALLFAIIALIIGHGRVPAVFGLLLSIGTVIGGAILLVAIASAGSGLANLGN